MADEQDRWLDRETAEILLRGESLEAVDPAARDRAERLAGALGALSAPPPVPAGGELPGEAAALAAFRKVRAERADAPEGASAALGHGTATPPADAGLVRIGPRGDGARRPRRHRPLRLGLAAALTVGMLGGAAVAAGTGALPTPFDGTRPDPAATVSAAASPDRPLASPSPLDGVRGGPVPGSPTPGAPDRGSVRGDADGDTDQDTDTDTDADGRASGGGRSGLVASCRDVRAGKGLDGARRRALKEAAGGSSRVVKYCGDLLAGTDGAARDRSGGREGGRGSDGSGERNRDRETGRGSGDKGGRSGQGDKSGKGGRSGQGGEEGRGGEGGKKGGGDDGGKDDDDDGHTAPPAGQHHDPHAPSAYAPLPRQRPAYPPHTSSTVADLPLDLRFSGLAGISSPRV
ncbi:hypothetical protein KBY55_00755 [Streptomyces sp. b94]|uniref:hypothetical protein n=1 Tax=Streptomyces sp. b94 TaxID=1827634 RepID=UPI001B397CFA|nr:hypothetical protein [Streptomyces sp. b94]MBQ1094665.1 hypothetical protein [Streptomyces sp. b94]